MMGFSNAENIFYEQAYTLIYNWLTEEEKTQFKLELLYEEEYDEKLNLETSFFRILQFVYVKYINLEKYTNGILNLTNDKLNKYSDIKIEDIIIDDLDNEISIKEIDARLKSENLLQIFHSFLKEINVQEEYENYIKTDYNSGEEYGTK